jgi:hypothetical protein
MLLPKTWKNLYYPPEKNEYEYFAAGSPHPFLTSSETRAAWAADAAMLAYGRYGRILIPDSGFDGILKDAGFAHHQRIGDWSEGAAGTQAFFACNGNFAILAFRGTERDDPTDSATDADILLVPEKDYTISSGHLHPFHFLADLAYGQACSVHQGFQRALNSVWQDISDCITAYRAANATAEICFAGHSLGGALATLAISRLADSKVSLSTIGCPRVGNGPFCSRVRKRASLGIYRYVNANDPVTHVPIDDLLYCHPETDWMHIIDADRGKIDTLRASDSPHAGKDWADLVDTIRALPHAGLPWNLDSPAPADLVDHSPVQYTTALWKKLDPNLQPIKAVNSMIV